MIKILRKLRFAKLNKKNSTEDFPFIEGESIKKDPPIPEISFSKDNSQKTKKITPNGSKNPSLPNSDIKLHHLKTPTLENEPEIELPTLLSKKGRLQKIDGFYQYLKAGSKSKRTIQEYKKDLRFWNQTAKENKKSIYKLTVHDIEKGVLNKNPSRKRRLISALKSLGKYYLRDGHHHLHIECQKIILGKKEQRIPKAKLIFVNLIKRKMVKKYLGGV